jgi:hypothetical protein
MTGAIMNHESAVMKAREIVSGVLVTKLSSRLVMLDCLG